MNKKTAPPIIVITGGTGSGKSKVAEVFKKLGARVMDVDLLARPLLRPGHAAWGEILAAFCGAKLLDPGRKRTAFQPADFTDPQGQVLQELPWAIEATGAIRRDRLGAAVFASPDALGTLNQIMHPRLRKLLENKIRLHGRRHDCPLVLDMAIYPSRWFRGIADAVLWVRSPGGMRVQRLADSNRMTLEDAGMRVRMQWRDEEYEKLADFTLPNLGSAQDLVQGAQTLWPKILRHALERGAHAFF